MRKATVIAGRTLASSLLAFSGVALAPPAVQAAATDVRVTISTECRTGERIYQLRSKNTGERRRRLNVRIASVGPATLLHYRLRPGQRVLDEYQLGRGGRVRVTYRSQQRVILRTTLVGANCSEG